MANQKCRTSVSFGEKRAGLLSWTSDMEAWSFSLPAGEACPMMRADDESYVCHGCYAQLNRYNMPNVLQAQWVRYMWTKECLKSTEGMSVWITTMMNTIHQYVKNGFFRGHDSGDFFHPDYVYMWYRVCQNMPEVRFWFPTRNWPHRGPMGAKWQTMMTLLGGLPNVSLRPSALRFNESVPIVAGYSMGTTVITDKSVATDLNLSLCPKTTNGGSCESNGCRACWSKLHGIAYWVHGVLGKHIVPNAFSSKIVACRNKTKVAFTPLTIKQDGPK